MCQGSRFGKIEWRVEAIATSVGFLSRKLIGGATVFLVGHAAAEGELPPAMKLDWQGAPLGLGVSRHVVCDRLAANMVAVIPDRGSSGAFNHIWHVRFLA